MQVGHYHIYKEDFLSDRFLLFLQMTKDIKRQCDQSSSGVKKWFDFITIRGVREAFSQRYLHFHLLSHRNHTNRRWKAQNELQHPHHLLRHMSLSHNWKYLHKQTRIWRHAGVRFCLLLAFFSIPIFRPRRWAGKGSQYEKRLLETRLKKHGTLSLVGSTQQEKHFYVLFVKFFLLVTIEGPLSSKGFVCKLQTILPCACTVAGVKIQPVSWSNRDCLRKNIWHE